MKKKRKKRQRKRKRSSIFHQMFHKEQVTLISMHLTMIERPSPTLHQLRELGLKVKFRDIIISFNREKKNCMDNKMLS